MPKGIGYPKTARKGAGKAAAKSKAMSVPTEDVSSMGGQHGRGVQSFAHGKPPVSAKQTRRVS